MKPAAFFAVLALAAALGALLVGRAVVIPGLSQHPELLDANFAKSIAEPLHLRLAEVVLAGHLIVAALARPWIGTRWATTMGLILVGGSAAHRFALLPALYAAWSKADLVAGRPVDHILNAQRLELQEVFLVAAMVVVQVGLLAAHVIVRSGTTSAKVPALERPSARSPLPTAA